MRTVNKIVGLCCLVGVCGLVAVSYHDAKDKEIAALRAQLAAKGSPGPSLGAVQHAPARPAAPAAAPAVLSDPEVTSLLTLDTPGARERFAAWVVVFGRGLTPHQRDRAASTFVQFAHEKAAEIRYFQGFSPLDKLGHVRDPAELVLKFQVWMRKGRTRRVDMSYVMKPEAAHAIYRYDADLFEKVLQDMKEHRFADTYAAVPRVEVADDYAATWVTIQSDEDLRRYQTWKDAIGKGLSPGQAARAREKIIVRLLLGIPYLSDQRVPLFDDLGHFKDLSALTIFHKRYQLKVLQLPTNFGPEAGAAIFNFNAAQTEG